MLAPQSLRRHAQGVWNEAAQVFDLEVERMLSEGKGATSFRVEADGSTYQITVTRVREP